MIQRIQTVYLLLVAILMIITLFLPTIEFASDEAFYRLSYAGFQRVNADGTTLALEHAWMLTLLTAIIAVIAFITIWLYKLRPLQIRLTIFNSLLLMGYYGLFFYFRYYYSAKYEISADSILLPVALPLVCIVLNYLAFRGIAKDDAIVKSYDRLR